LNSSENEAVKSLANNQDQNGIDMARVASNLKLSPTERVRKLQAAAKSLCEVRAAAYSAGLRKTD